MDWASSMVLHDCNGSRCSSESLTISWQFVESNPACVQTDDTITLKPGQVISRKGTVDAKDAVVYNFNYTHDDGLTPRITATTSRAVSGFIHS